VGFQSPVVAGPCLSEIRGPLQWNECGCGAARAAEARRSPVALSRWRHAHSETSLSSQSPSWSNLCRSVAPWLRGSAASPAIGWLWRFSPDFGALTLLQQQPGHWASRLDVLCTAGRLATGSPLLGWTHSWIKNHQPSIHYYFVLSVFYLSVYAS